MAFGRKTAEKLDGAAAKLHKVGRKVGGERGGRAGDAVANVTIAPLRRRCGKDCTRRNCNHN